MQVRQSAAGQSRSDWLPHLDEDYLRRLEPEMTPDAILKDLTESRELPRSALRAAGQRREEMVPVFLDIVEKATATPVEELRDYDGFLFIFHLLGEWREPRAYLPLAKLLRRDSEGLEVLIGDAITESAARVMAGVCDGDPQPLFDIIEDIAADEFIRSEMFETLAILALQDAALRPSVSAFLRRFFDGARSDVTTPVWSGWTEAIAALGLPEIVPLVRQVYERGLIEPSHSDFADFERRVNSTLQDPSAHWFRRKPQNRFIEDTIEELSKWHCFSEAYLSDQDRARPSGLGSLFDAVVPAPHFNELRGVGRNDPCPCGSGKKFKKCCLH